MWPDPFTHYQSLTHNLSLQWHFSGDISSPHGIYPTRFHPSSSEYCLQIGVPNQVIGDILLWLWWRNNTFYNLLVEMLNSVRPQDRWNKGLCDFTCFPNFNGSTILKLYKPCVKTRMIETSSSSTQLIAKQKPEKHLPVLVEWIRKETQIRH